MPVMSSTSMGQLDGVKFKLSDACRLLKIVELPPDFDLKDPDVLLEDFEYDFSMEHQFIASQHPGKKKLHKYHEDGNLQKSKHVKDANYTSTHTSSNRKPIPRVMHPYPITKQEVTSVKAKRNDAVSPSRKHEILNEFTNLLTADAAYTQDPPEPQFANKAKTNAKYLSATHVDRPNPVPLSICKSKVLDEFTDVLTADVMYTQDSPTSTLKKRNSKDIFSECSANPVLKSSASSLLMTKEQMEIARDWVGGSRQSPTFSQNSSEWEDITLNELTSTQKSFVQSIMSMGFKEYEVIRAIQKHGENQKEVLDHLFKVRTLLQKGYTTDGIEDALEFFNENEEEAEKFLVLERQFAGMGFSCDRVKEALLLHDRDEAKVYAELMMSE